MTNSRKSLFQILEYVITKSEKTWITYFSIICNNKLRKQKDQFLLSDSKSLQVILPFYENGFFRFVNINLRHRFTNID